MESDQDQSLIDAVEQGFADLGVTLKMTSDPDLENYRKGKALTGDQFHKLKVGDLVWIRIKKYGSDGYRADNTHRIDSIEDGTLSFRDGSSFTTEAALKEVPEGSTKAVQHFLDWGYQEFYEAIPKKSGLPKT